MPTDMPRCETCRHWTPDEKAGKAGLLANLEGRWGDCAYDDARVLPTPYGGEDGLLTKSDFGCVAHEPRD